MQRITSGLILATTTLMAGPALAADKACNGDLTLDNGVNCASNGGSGFIKGDLGSILGTVSKVLIFLVGALAIIMIIVGGLRYVLSSGNATSTEAARNTILYAVIGLVVAVAAFAIVTFVTGRLGL